ncbi:MAG: hypothetical protein ACTSUE_07650 [Promethearchaeota archaeon]
MNHDAIDYEPIPALEEDLEQNLDSIPIADFVDQVGATVVVSNSQDDSVVLRKTEVNHNHEQIHQSFSNIGGRLLQTRKSFKEKSIKTLEMTITRALHKFCSRIQESNHTDTHPDFTNMDRWMATHFSSDAWYNYHSDSFWADVKDCFTLSIPDTDLNLIRKYILPEHAVVQRSESCRDGWYKLRYQPLLVKKLTYDLGLRPVYFLMLTKATYHTLMGMKADTEKKKGFSLLYVYIGADLFDMEKEKQGKIKQEAEKKRLDEELAKRMKQRQQEALLRKQQRQKRLAELYESFHKKKQRYCTCSNFVTCSARCCAVLILILFSVWYVSATVSRNNLS